MVAASPPAGAAAAPGSPRHVAAYVSAVTLVAATAAAVAIHRDASLVVPAVLTWTAMAVLGQVLQFPTLTGNGRVSLSTCTHLCMMVLLGPAEVVAALVLGRLAGQVVQRAAWHKVLFNTAQVILAVLAGGLAYRALGGPARPEPSFAGMLAAAPAFLAGALVYYVVNMAAVTGVLSLATRRPVLRVWREDYGHPAELAGTAALVLMTPVAVVCAVSLGAPGLALFVLPLVFIRDASRRYVELRRSQDTLIEAERLAAKGQLAAEVGHEISNCLIVVEGQLQVLAFKSERVTEEELRRRLSRTAEELSKIQVLSRELIDYSRAPHAPRPTKLVELVRDTIASVSHQQRFEDIRITATLDPRAREARLDAHQLQQLLISLLVNAADAIRAARPARRVIAVGLTLEREREAIELTVGDTGPGVAPDLRRRIFEPRFTTRPGGRGFGLSIVQGIVRNYGGSVRVEDAPQGGALFRVVLPFAAIGIPGRDRNRAPSSPRHAPVVVAEHTAVPDERLDLAA